MSLISQSIAHNARPSYHFRFGSLCLFVKSSKWHNTCTNRSIPNMLITQIVECSTHWGPSCCTLQCTYRSWMSLQIIVNLAEVEKIRDREQASLGPGSIQHWRSVTLNNKHKIIYGTAICWRSLNTLYDLLLVWSFQTSFLRCNKILSGLYELHLQVYDVSAHFAKTHFWSKLLSEGTQMMILTSTTVFWVKDGAILFFPVSDHA